jgi:hypothetical protein
VARVGSASVFIILTGVGVGGGGCWWFGGDLESWLELSCEAAPVLCIYINLFYKIYIKNNIFFCRTVHVMVSALFQLEEN